MATKNDDDFINTLIGEGTTFKGELETTGQVRIDGDFLGTLTTKGKVLLSRTGRMKADIRAKEITIGGVLKGDIVASDKVQVLQSGLVLGKITSPSLQIDVEAIIDGVCHITPQVTESLHPAFQNKDYYSVSETLKKDKKTSENRSFWNP